MQNWPLPLHYFTGRVRAFWNDLIFFSDARNVAVIDIGGVYINGSHASSRDLRYLEELVRNSDWKGSPEFHSYVSEYPCDLPTPWPYQLSGKILWKAKCAWLGWIPNCIKNDNMNNVIHNPISYYTGMAIELCNDKIIFGDIRNTVIVSSDNFYVNGERGFNNIHSYLADTSWAKIHAYIVRLEVLTDTHHGPEPDLPTWPKQNLSSDLWVAKFAWFGDMPSEVRDQVGRYYVIRMNQWGNTQSVPWKNESGWQGSSHEKSEKKRCCYEDKQKDLEKEVRSCQSLVPTEISGGYIRGSLLIADNKQALIRSHVDLIAFSKANFYVNGKEFQYHYDLSYFFKDHKDPLTAWVMHLDKPIIMFNINVVWVAVCVWYGSPPKNLEYIVKGDHGKIVDNLVETATSVSLTHFLGYVHDLSFTSGVLMSKAGLNQDVKISFQRNVVHLFGSKFDANYSLLDKQHILENNTWSVLAHPVLADQTNAIPHYEAVVMWQYNNQHYINMLSETISEFVDETRNCKGKEKLAQHMSGYITKVSDDYGIMRVKTASAYATYLYFRKDVLYIDGELFPKNVPLEANKQGMQCCAQAKTILPKKVDGCQVTMEATLIWIGRKPSIEYEKMTPDCSGSPVHIQNTDSNDRKASAAKMQTESHSKLDKVLHAAEGEMVGSVLIVDKHHGLIICSDIIVAFSSDTFYVDGNKFNCKYDFFNEFCSDRKITVRVMVASLRTPKVVLNCAVMCEAVCAWIGQKPNDLTRLQKEHSEKNKSLDVSKTLHKPLLYFMGQMTHACKDVTLLASATPGGISKITFSKENLFINGTAVHQDNIFEKCKRNTSHSWSILACPMSQKDIMGHSVCYTAVAVWDMSHHHKMREVLPLVACQLNELPNKQEHCSNKKLNGLSKATPDTPEALLHTLKLEDSSKEEKLVKVKESSQLNDPSVIVSPISKKSTGDEKCIASVDLIALCVSKKEFCGKHITGYIVKKNGRDGVAQWKSQLFEGFVFIEFSIKTLYLDLETVNENWKVSDVQSRPCNFYVIPIVHHSVGLYTVSLKATCGWMGKKPSHIPSPGTQLVPKIDLSSVHVTQPNDIQDSKLEIVEIPPKTFQNDVDVNETFTLKSPVQPNLPSLFIATTGNSKDNVIQETQNREASRIKTYKPPQPVLPYKPTNVGKNKCGKIWDDKNKEKIHHQGTIVEVHSSVGQLEGEDGSLHYFPNESCYLFGVRLHNVELWHVLAQGDPVLYTVMELVPGMMKVQKVWLGALELPNNQTANEHILDWCQTKLVPDGARDILVSQLELK